MSDEIVFEEPPPMNTAGRPRYWQEHLAPLRARPGEWACVRVTNARNAQVTVTNLRGGKMGAGLDRAEWEFTSRSDSATNTGKVYARFVGKPDLKSA